MYIDNIAKKKLVDKYKDEQVFVVPYESVKHIEDKFVPIEGDLDELRKYDMMGKYILRHDAEYNPAFQQLIPYALITNSTGDKYYVSKRIAGDARLLENLSLGFGGHINPCDGSLSVVLAALERELDEEVSIDKSDDEYELLGTVRDLTSKTSDHLGFVFEVKVNSAEIKEKDTLEGVWMTKQELVDNYFRFEGWSKYVIDYFFENDNVSE